MKRRFLLTAIFLLFVQALLAQPVITSFSPASGAIGTLVTITGTNLGTPTAFTIGGTTALMISNTGTQLVGYVMPGAVTGVISIAVAGGTVNSKSNFTVTPPPTVQLAAQPNGTLQDNASGITDQGQFVAVSADGNTAVTNSTSNMALVWARTATCSASGMWSLQAQLTGTNNFFNFAETGGVAISADGNTIAVGAPGNDTTATGNDGTGVIWVFTRSGATWTQQGASFHGSGGKTSPEQGWSVALSADGNTLFEGGLGDNYKIGAGWIFTRSNGVWTQQGPKLVGTGYLGRPGEGFSCALSADGNTAIMGGVDDDSPNLNASPGIGAAWIFARSGTTWSQQGPKMVGSGYASPNGDVVLEGYAVALSADGSTAIIAADDDNDGQGAIWAFTRSNGTWTQQGAKLVGTGVVGYASQGNGVGLSADGNTLLEGGRADNSEIGAMWEFSRSNGVWTQLGAKIPSPLSSPSQFGTSVALSADGTTALAGAPAYNTYGALITNVAPPPTASTQAATDINATGATLNGEMTTNGFTTTVTIQYSTSPDMTGATTATLSSGTSPIPSSTCTSSFTSVLTGLVPYTTYYFTITGVNAYGTTQGSVLSFATAGIPPYISASSTVSGTISACAGTASASPFIQQFMLSGGSLTTGLTVTAPAGFEVSLATGSGYSAIITIPETGGNVNNTTVYVRSAASAPAGMLTGNVVLSSTGALSMTEAVSGSINALPVVNPVTGQTFTSGMASTAINFTGTANSFLWTNDAPGIGLAASGTGNIASFSPVNTGSSPVTAHITVTPVNAGFAYIPNFEDGTVSVISELNNTVVATIPVSAQPDGVAVSPDGSKVYITTGLSQTVNVISTQTNKVIATIPLTNANTTIQPVAIAVSPDGSRLYVTFGNSGGASTVSVINASTYAVIASIGVNSEPEGVAISPDGTTVYVGNYNSNNLSVINAQTNIVTATIPVGTNPKGISVSPNGTTVYVANYDSNTISVINAQTNLVAATIMVNAAPTYMCVSADGSRLYVVNEYSNNVSVINTATNAVVATIAVGIHPFGISISPDGSSVYVTNLNSTSVSVISTATGTVTATVPVGNQPYAPGNFATANGCSGTSRTFTITVNPAPLNPATITFPPLASQVYGSADVASGATSTNTVTPITYASSNTAVATITASGNIHIVGAGNTQITASQAASSTYGAATPVAQPFIVTPAPLTITASSPTALYGAGIPALTVTYNALVNGDTPASLTTQPTVATTATGSSGVGKYPTTASGAVDANYTITYAPGTLVITPASLTIAANNQSIVFGSPIPALTVTYTGLVNGDTQASLSTQPTVTTTATATSPAGIYPIAVNGGVDHNYTITDQSGSLSITAGAPTATTLAATGITASVATLNGSANDNGAPTTVTITYSTSPTLAGATTAPLTTGVSPIAAGTGTTSFTSVLTGLGPSTTYYFMISATNATGTTNGSILSFTTAPPVVITFTPPGDVVYGSTTTPVIAQYRPNHSD